MFSTTANEGHFAPTVPFARGLVATGHDVRVAAPVSFGATLARAGLAHEPFADAPPEVIGPIMASLPTMTVQEADKVVVREVFGRIDARAALPALLTTIRGWRPQLVVRESAELGSLAAAERCGVPHVQVCIGMHEVAARLAELVDTPLQELGRIAGLAQGHLTSALQAETLLSLVPECLDYPSGQDSPPPGVVHRFHEPAPAVGAHDLPVWGDPELPLVYVTFGSVTGSLPPFRGVFGAALEALAGHDVRVLMTVGRTVEPRDLEPLPANAHVAQWIPQDAALSEAAAVLGHGGFGTTMGAVTAGVPQLVVPLFTFDQVANGAHIAAVGAGITTGMAPDAVQRAASDLPRLLADPAFGQAAGQVATALRELPAPAEAVPVLAALAH